MPEVTTNPPGSFCWPELGTSNYAAAKAFYTSVFGWEITESEMVPGEYYATFLLGGRRVAAGYQLNADMQKQGVPPHWMSYVSVADADQAAETARRLGGTVVMGPIDVMEHGRMAVIRDPQGAVISIWQPKTHPGIGRRDEPGCLCWTELVTTDTASARTFYTGLFGWGTKRSEVSGAVNYTEWQLAGTSIGGMMQMDEQWGNVPPHWMVYFQVSDADVTSARITAAGGRLAHGPFDAPGVGRIGIAADPQGAMFSIIRLNG